MQPIEDSLDQLSEKYPADSAILDSHNLKGKRIIVVGATGGIGEAVAGIASSLGAQAILTYHANRQKSEEMSRKTGATAFQYTHGSHETASHLVKQLPNGINYLLDASGMPAQATMAKILKNPGLFIEPFATNTFGPFFLFLELMASGKLESGAQLAYASTIAVDGNPGQPHYAASKAAMGAAILSLGKEPAAEQNGFGLKSLELALVDTGNHVVRTFMRHVSSIEMDKPGTIAALKSSGYLMSPQEAAFHSLAAMADSSRTGLVRIPADATVDKIQEILHT